MALLATLIAHYTLCYAQYHWCWASVSQIVVLGWLIPTHIWVSTFIAIIGIFWNPLFVPETTTLVIFTRITILVIPTTVILISTWVSTCWLFTAFISGHERLICPFRQQNQIFKTGWQVQHNRSLHLLFQPIQVEMHGCVFINCFITQFTLKVTKQCGILLYWCSLFNCEQSLPQGHIFIYVLELWSQFIHKIR